MNSSAPGGLKIQFSAPSTVFGTRAVYSCAEGFQIVGSNERTCETNGNWTGVEPHCEGIQRLCWCDIMSLSHFHYSNSHTNDH